MGRRWRFLFPVALALTAPVLAFATAPLLARALGPDGRGDLALFLAIFTFAGVLAASGVEEAAVSRVAHRGGFSVSEAKQIHLRLVASGLLGGLAAAIVVWHTSKTAAAACLLLGFLTPRALDRGVALGSGEALLLGYERTLAAATRAVILVLLYVTTQLTVGAAALVTASCAALGTLVYLGRRPFQLTPQDAAPVRPLWALGRQFLAVHVATAALLRLDQLVLAVNVPRSALGYYAASVGLVEASLSLNAAFKPAILRSWAGVHGVRRSGDATALWTLAAIQLACLSLLAVAAPLVVRSLLGPAFVPAVPLMRILVVSQAFLLVQDMLLCRLTFLGMASAANRGLILPAVLNALLIWPIASRFGAVGVAWLAVATYACTCASYLKSLRTTR